MSNKRIEKKRAKAMLQRDKATLIASMLVLENAGRTHAEYIKIAKRLWRYDIKTLLDIAFEMTRRHMQSPLRWYKIK